MNELTPWSRIRERRKQLGISQARLGELVGSPQHTISAIESGSRPQTSAVMMRRIADALGLSLDLLFPPNWGAEKNPKKIPD